MRKDRKNQEIIDAYDYLSNAASSQDLTGLIPSAPSSAPSGHLPPYGGKAFRNLPPRFPSLWIGIRLEVSP